MQMQSSVILTKNYVDLLAATFFEEYSRLLKVYVNASTLEDPPYDMNCYVYSTWDLHADFCTINAFCTFWYIQV